eukprot:TRINITY_DN6333_c0_g1_i1.p1 TRINITY_DN6333_c0_g1~~TRINITY_DN6333_c0_g1_i1.p1  ORF type:complete len:549 (+),score=186.78 TRINITY_DN6333_c0_g1_i1:136-1782(+)
METGDEQQQQQPQPQQVWMDGKQDPLFDELHTVVGGLRGGRRSQLRGLVRAFNKIEKGKGNTLAAALRDFDPIEKPDCTFADDDVPTESGKEGETADSKSAAVTAAMLTFVMAMLSCPLATCIPVTHLHLSRLPIGAGHSSIMDALRREWSGRDFDVRLHVYQKTRHVSGVVAVSPGLDPSALESLRRAKPDKYYIPLTDFGEKMVAEESKRDRDPKLFAKYRDMVLAGLGYGGYTTDLVPTRMQESDSPIVYVRVMADRMQPNELLSTIADIKEEGLVYLLQRYPSPLAPSETASVCDSDSGSTCESLTENTGTLTDLVRLIALDKSAARQHMHRTHFGRAFFLECVDAEAARAVIKAIQKRSVQSVDGIRFSIHAETKRAGQSREQGEDGEKKASLGRLFEQDVEKREHCTQNLNAARAAVDTLQHVECCCQLPAQHTMALHNLFTFKKTARGKNFEASSRDAGSSADSNCGEDTESVFSGVDSCSTGTEASVSVTHQPYDCEDIYGFPSEICSPDWGARGSGTVSPAASDYDSTEEAAWALWALA